MLIKFFHVACVLLYSFSIVREVHSRWENDLPRQLVCSRSKKDGIFALNYFMLWLCLNNREALTRGDETTFLDDPNFLRGLSQFFEPLVDDDNPNKKLTTLALGYFDRNIKQSQKEAFIL